MNVHVVPPQGQAAWTAFALRGEDLVLRRVTVFSGRSVLILVSYSLQ